METKRFISNSMAKLHARVRKELGEDAVIVGTRTLHRDGAAPLIEMIAGLPDAEQSLSLEVQHTVIEAALKRAEFVGNRISAADFGALVDLMDDDGASEGNFKAKREPSIAPDPDPSQPQPEWLQGFVGDAPAPPGEHEMPGVRLATSEALEPGPNPEPSQTTAYSHPFEFGAELLEAGLSRLAVDAIADYAPDASSAQNALARTLARPVRYPSDGRTAVVTVQGPAGSGRTSALMRMALDCAESGRETILVASDGTRAAARDQVHSYAEALRLQSVDAYSGADLEMVTSRATPGACLFVDVEPGSWRRPAALMAENFAYRVLPSHWEFRAARGEFWKLPKGSYSGCIPTFTDLASGMSPVLSLALEAELGLAFLSSSRDVSTGITLADPNTLASGVLQKSTRETSDGRLGAIA